MDHGMKVVGEIKPYEVSEESDVCEYFATTEIRFDPVIESGAMKEADEYAERYKVKMPFGEIDAPRRAMLIYSKEENISPDAKSKLFSYHMLPKIDWKDVPNLNKIRRALEKQLIEDKYLEKGDQFTCCLLNVYESGRDGIAYHSDKEAMENKYQEATPVVSFTLGQARDFYIRSVVKTKGTDAKYSLGHGACMVMKKGAQKKFLHSIPKRGTKRKTNAPFITRYCATFRIVKPKFNIK